MIIVENAAIFDVQPVKHAAVALIVPAQVIVEAPNVFGVRLSQRLAAQVLRDPAAQRQITDRHSKLAELRERLLTAVQASTRLTVIPARGGTHLLVHAKRGDDPWRILKDARVVGLPGVVFNSPVPAVRLCTAQPGEVIEAAAKVVRTL